MCVCVLLVCDPSLPLTWHRALPELYDKVMDLLEGQVAGQQPGPWYEVQRDKEGREQAWRTGLSTRSCLRSPLRWPRISPFSIDIGVGGKTNEQKNSDQSKSGNM